MTTIPPMILFVNGDISFPVRPPPPDVLGADPPLYIGANPASRISELTNLQRQLNIDETMCKEEFDARVEGTPEYPRIVHLQGLRILVILESFQDMYLRNLADVVLFVKQGLASVQKNKFDCEYFYEYDEEDPCHRRQGRPRLTLDMQRLNIYELLRYNHSPNVVPNRDDCFDEWRERRFTGAFGCECDHCIRRNGLYKWVPENLPGRLPYDLEGDIDYDRYGNMDCDYNNRGYCGGEYCTEHRCVCQKRR